MIVYLLDVNVLLALSDPCHIHHEFSHIWFQKLGQNLWATCPITQNGFTRIISHPSYPNCPGNPSVALLILKRFCQDPRHRFWPSRVSLLNKKLFSSTEKISHTQITDIYLLGLAAQQRGKLATFDQNIPAHAVRGGIEALELIHAQKH